VKAGAEKLLQESQPEQSEKKWMRHRPTLTYEWDTKRGKLTPIGRCCQKPTLKAVEQFPIFGLDRLNVFFQVGKNCNNFPCGHPTKPPPDVASSIQDDTIA
jgi:hypothetical protein